MNDTCKDCRKPIHFVLHLGLWYHDTPTSVLACPAEIVGPAGLLGALIPAELSGLAHKLSGAAHAAHNVTEALALAASLFRIGTDEEERIWASRRRWAWLADDLAELAADCRAQRAVLAVRMAADA